MAILNLNITGLIPGKIREARLQEVELAANNKYLQDALVKNKREGQKLAIYARWAALAVIAIFLPFVNFSWAVLYYEFLLLVFALLGWAQLKVAQVGQSKIELFLIICDLVLMSLVILIPNPFFEQQWPNAIQYRFENFLYFFVLLAGATLAYSWRTIFAFSTWTAGLWTAGLLIVSFFGRQLPELTDRIKTATADYPLMLEFIDPNNLQLGIRIQEIVVFLIVAGILALNGWRNSQLLLKQADIARERANLARHFPPNIVDQMADQDQPLGQIRSQKVAVMFADIVGFTHMAEQNNPEDIVALLREFHQRIEKAVFDNNGTLDKFLGDGIMATFGTPLTSPDDAKNAVSCARDMLSSIDQWNGQREAQGKSAIKLSIGVHFGNVILGDIGSHRRLEFATLGDTVNVASRLEELTRSLDTQMIVSKDLMEAAALMQKDQNSFLQDNFACAGQKVLRGRTNETEVWTFNGFQKLVKSAS